ncbi:MAG: amidohydrolase family protein [Victivallales bacterium]|nr:amidohydrolase family protein [Victivallales bacterium]MCF7889562.1 amidohydrolase family protein [Victivallales bacterium]
MKDTKYKLIRSRLLIPFSQKRGLSQIIQDGYVFIGGRLIREVGKYSDSIGQRILKEYGDDLHIIGKKKGDTEIPCINGVVMPGFVKVHGHNHEPPLIGIAKDEPLVDWLDHAVNPFTGFLNEKKDYIQNEFGLSGGYITFIKALLDDIHYGITSAMNHQCNFAKYIVGDVVKAGQEAGTKLIVAVGSQDRNYDRRILDTPEIAVDRLESYNREFGSIENIQIVPGPDQVFSNSDSIIKAQKEWADKNGTVFHMHSSEEPRTTAWFTEQYGCTPVEYLNKAGILDESVILAHQVNTTENDMKILKETGTNIVHNPLANTILGSGMPKVVEMINRGIPVAISTDGSGSADNQNILSAARLASQYQKAALKDARVMKAQDVLERITVKAAKMLRLNTGSLEKGKDGDLVLIDLNKNNMVPTRADNVMETLVWCTDGSEVRWVIGNGKILKDDYEIKHLDVKKIKADIFKLSEMMMEYKEGYKEVSETGARSKK